MDQKKYVVSQQLDPSKMVVPPPMLATKAPHIIDTATLVALLVCPVYIQIMSDVASAVALYRVGN
jgi:hypothetical protein